MKLIYRGATYDYHSAKPQRQPTRRSEAYTLMYRGETYRVDPNAIAQPVVPAQYELIYRGVTYWVKRDEAGKMTMFTSRANATSQGFATVRSS
jgi:Domain of unknown function (DUF4278)